jgi:hypothetical protein
MLRRTQHQTVPHTLSRLLEAEDELFWPMVVSRSLRPAVGTVGPIEATITWGE